MAPPPSTAWPEDLVPSGSAARDSASFSRSSSARSSDSGSAARGRLRCRLGPPLQQPVGGDPADNSADPRDEALHRADATVTAASCPVIAPFSPERRRQSGPTSRPWEGRTSGRDDLRNSADAGPGAGRGAPGRHHRAHARARREGRRHLAEPRRVGPAPPRVSDRAQGGGRLPPRRLRRGGGDARRDLPRAQDRRRGAAPSGDAPHRGLPHERAARRRGSRRPWRSRRRASRPPPSR